MAKKLLVPITVRAVVQRVNRCYKRERTSWRLKKSKGLLAEADLGEFYTLDILHNAVGEDHVDLEKHARGLAVLEDWEIIVDRKPSTSSRSKGKKG